MALGPSCLCEDGIDKSIPRDHRLASRTKLVMPNVDSEGPIFLSHPHSESHTERFLVEFNCTLFSRRRKKVK